jgi:hypothetical protein
MSESLDKAEIKNSINIKARGTIIEVPKDIAFKVDLIRTFYENKYKKDTDYFDMNFSSLDVHNFIDYLSGYKYKKTDILAQILDFFQLNKNTLIQTGLTYSGFISSCSLSSDPSSNYKSIRETMHEFIYDDKLIKTINYEHNNINNATCKCTSEHSKNGHKDGYIIQIYDTTNKTWNTIHTTPFNKTTNDANETWKIIFPMIKHKINLV